MSDSQSLPATLFHHEDIQATITPFPQPSSTRKLRIALLGYRSNPHSGGQGIYLRYLSKALVDLGHQVDVISGQPYPVLDSRVKLIKLPGMNLFETGLASLRPHHLTSLTNILEWLSKLSGGFGEPYAFGRRIKKYMRSHAVDYDVIHDNQTLSWGTLALQQSGLPLVTTIHHPITRDLRLALDAAPSLASRWLIKRWHAFLNMQKKVAQRLNYVVTVSDCSRRDIITDFELQSGHISRIYNGIDTDVFCPQPNIARRDNLIIATASADAPLKGLRYLLEAFHQISQNYPDLNLLVIGKLKPGGETARLIKRLALTDRVQFVSGVSTRQLVSYYARATMAVVPSLYEGFGLPAGEAMACGVPVIASDGGALPEVVGDAGLQCPAADSKALARAISQLLDHPEQRMLLSEAGRQRIVEQFSWQVVAQQMTHYYLDVLANYETDVSDITLPVQACEAEC